MGKKGKGGGDGGGKGPKEAQPTEAESTLLLKIAALQEKLDAAQRAADTAVTGHGEVQAMLEKQKKDQADIVAYLNQKFDKKTDDYDELKSRYERLLREKDASEKKLGSELGDLKDELSKTQAKLADSEDENGRLKSDVREIGELRSTRDSDSATKTELTDELDIARHRLKERDQQLTVLAAVSDRICGEDGERGLAWEGDRRQRARRFFCFLDWARF